MIKISKKSFLVIFIIAVVAAVGGAAFMYLNSHTDKKTYAFIIDNQKYTKKDIKNLVSFANQVSPATDNVKIAFSAYKDQLAAKKLGMTVPQIFIDNQKASLNKTYSKYSGGPNSDWVNLMAFDNALKQFLSSGLSSTTPQGYSFVFWAIQHVASVYITGTPPQGTGDSTVIEADKTYALQRANYYHDQIASSKMTNEQAQKEIISDSRISQSSSATSNFSTKFGFSDTVSWRDQVYVPNIQDYISQLTKTGLSSVQSAELTADKQDYGAFYFFTDTSQLGGKTFTQSDLVKQVTLLKSTYYGI
jgi:uncharacterized protein YxeA